MLSESCGRRMLMGCLRLLQASTSRREWVKLIPAGGFGGSGLAPPMPAVAKVPGRNGAGAKRRRSEAHAEPGEST